MEKMWIVVADGAHARILAATAQTSRPTTVMTLEHPESRLKEHELVADKPGRSKDSIGQGHQVDEAKSEEKEKVTFSSHIVQQLEEGRQKGRFESLILVAAPNFLGKLRHELTKPLAKMVTQSLDKDLVTHDEESIRRHLFTS